MTRGTVAVLDSGNASYERLVWTEKGDGLSVLKGTEDRALRDKRYAVLGFTGFGAGTPQRAVYDPDTDKSFPTGMSISPNRNPQWTDDLQALTFGIHVPRKRDGAADANETDQAATRDEDDAGRSAPPEATNANPDEKVDLGTLALARQTLADTAGSAGSRRPFVQLPRRVPGAAARRSSASPTRTCARSTSRRNSGSRLVRTTASTSSSVISTGGASRISTSSTWRPARVGSRSSARAGTTARHPTATRSSTTRTATITSIRWSRARRATSRAAAPVSFVDSEDDHNVVKPPAGSIGWTRDSASVLLTDNWDIWQVPVNGGSVVNLTANGRKDQVRYQRRYPIEPVAERALGIDLARPQYFAAYGEWTKKAGIARLTPGKSGVEMLDWSDAVLQHAGEGAEHRAVCVHALDGDRAERLLHHRCELRQSRSAHRSAPAGRRLRLDRRGDARQLHERQG